jgi:hypothetical protein
VFCGEFLLAARLRPADIDGAAGTVPVLAAIPGEVSVCWGFVVRQLLGQEVA